MSERFPWEVDPQEPPESAGRHPQDADDASVQMELDPGPSPGAPAPEPPPVRPHGDPHRAAPHPRPVARKEYYSIGEVSELAGLPPHVLRYWESQFPVLNPSKNRSGNRAYQRKEIKLILLVKHLLYEEKYTVEGAKARLDRLRKGGQLQEHTARALDTQTVALLKEELAELRELLALP
jgi:DNA-binding transcriptional MerR regulator